MAGIDSAIAKAVAKYLDYELKNEQKSVIECLIKMENVMAILPTGYGKSVCYGLFPKVLQELYPDDPSPIALIISPLKSLMFDQVNIWTKTGISAAAIQPLTDMDQSVIQGILNGDYELIFSSPEAILVHVWWGMVKKLRHRIKLLVFDEVHCLAKWGETFRPGYKDVTKIRSVLTKTPVLSLTATATQNMVTEIHETIHVPKNHTNVIGVVPDRPNIFLGMQKSSGDILIHLDWYIEQLRREGPLSPRAIIYARTVDSVTRIYGKLMSTLGNKAWVGPNKDVTKRIVEMFHAQTDEDTKDRILLNFPEKESPLRCVVATIAFGMGVQVSDVRIIIHWGPSKDVLSYWQEVGRCARDGQPGKALMYLPPKSTDKRYISADMLNLIQSTIVNGKCIRSQVLTILTIPGMTDPEEDKGDCCSVCQSKSIT